MGERRTNLLGGSLRVFSYTRGLYRNLASRRGPKRSDPSDATCHSSNEVLGHDTLYGYIRLRRRRVAERIWTAPAPPSRITIPDEAYTRRRPGNYSHLFRPTIAQRRRFQSPRSRSTSRLLALGLSVLFASQNDFDDQTWSPQSQTTNLVTSTMEITRREPTPLSVPSRDPPP